MAHCPVTILLGARFLACVLVAILHPSETDASISLACQKSQRENTIALAQIAATETNL